MLCALAVYGSWWFFLGSACEIERFGGSFIISIFKVPQSMKAILAMKGIFLHQTLHALLGKWELNINDLYIANDFTADKIESIKCLRKPMMSWLVASPFGDQLLLWQFWGQLFPGIFCFCAAALLVTLRFSLLTCIEGSSLHEPIFMISMLRPCLCERMSNNEKHEHGSTSHTYWHMWKHRSRVCAWSVILIGPHSSMCQCWLISHPILNVF